MKSRVPASAQCRSSNTITTGPVAARRSKKVRQPANSSSGPPVGLSMPSSASSEASTQRRSGSSGMSSASFSASLALVTASPSVSARPHRLRTISPRAQNVTPWP